jgi:hypothetical protein
LKATDGYTVVRQWIAFSTEREIHGKARTEGLAYVLYSLAKFNEDGRLFVLSFGKRMSSALFIFLLIREGVGQVASAIARVGWG